MKRKYFAFYAILSLIGIIYNGDSKAVWNDEAVVQKGNPNIVILVVDTLRADHLPFYGYTLKTTPFLAKLASQSIIFDNAYSASSWTPPSTASIFTSLYPFQHKVVMALQDSVEVKIALNRIPERLETIAEFLKKQDYKTYAATDNINICKDEGFDQGFDMFVNHDYDTAEVVNGHVKEWAEDIKNQEKYFLYLHYNDPHHPLNKREPWYEKKEDSKENYISMYDSEISYADAHISELYDLLSWDKNTLVIFTADHGEELWDHDDMGHGYTLYNEVTRVPLFVYFPEDQRKTGRIQHNVSTMDIFPTIRAYLGLEPDPDHEGVSLLPLMKNPESVKNERHIFSHLDRKHKTRGDMLARSTVYRNWKWYRMEPHEGALFNLENDPGEKTDVSKENPAITADLAGKYRTFEKNCVKYDRETVDYYLDEKTKASLRALGYTQ